MFSICVIPKIPEMHRVRLFGVNSTTGIDDEIDYRRNGSGNGSPRGSPKVSGSGSGSGSRKTSKGE